MQEHSYSGNYSQIGVAGLRNKFLSRRWYRETMAEMESRGCVINSFPGVDIGTLAVVSKSLLSEDDGNG